MKFGALLAAFVMLFAGGASAQGAATPTDAVDAFHRALRNIDTAGALSLLARDLVVYEFGVTDPTLEAYAFRHLPLDMDTVSQTDWELVSRQVGGAGDIHWVLSNYRVTGIQADAETMIDQITSETVILRRSGDLFRIVHFHWSTDDPTFQADAQGTRLKGAP